jgi:hypothetical protein
MIRKNLGKMSTEQNIQYACIGPVILGGAEASAKAAS